MTATISSDAGIINCELPEVPDEWKGQLLALLSRIIDPDFNTDIVSLGFVQNIALNPDSRQLSLDVQLTTGMHRQLFSGFVD